MTVQSQQVGRLVRQLRKQRDITGIELGKRAGLSQSKISKIETGYYPVLHAAEVEKILNILDAPKTIRQQVSVALGKMNMERLQIGVPGLQLRIKPPEYRRNVKQYRIFGINLIPVLLQIAPYRHAILKSYSMDQDDINEWMKEMITRQDLLWQKDVSFYFVIHEAALYTSPATTAEQLAQLDRVERVMDIKNVTLGIIPLQAGLTLTENASFALHDDAMVSKTIANGEIESTDEEDIALHARIFKELERLSVGGDEAKMLIRRAYDYFSAL